MVTQSIWPKHSNKSLEDVRKKQKTFVSHTLVPDYLWFKQSGLPQITSELGHVKFELDWHVPYSGILGPIEGYDNGSLHATHKNRNIFLHTMQNSSSLLLLLLVLVVVAIVVLLVFLGLELGLGLFCKYQSLNDMLFWNIVRLLYILMKRVMAFIGLFLNEVNQ